MDLSVNQAKSKPEKPQDVPQDDNHKLTDEEKKLWKGKKPWKKQIYVNLLQQIEFYFSSSNLAKDRFMSKLIQEDPCKLAISIKCLRQIFIFLQMFPSRHL